MNVFARTSSDPSSVNVRGNLLVSFVCGNEIASLLKKLPRNDDQVSLPHYFSPP